MEAALPNMVQAASVASDGTNIAQQKLIDFQQVLNDLYNEISGGGRSVSVSAGAEFVGRDC